MDGVREWAAAICAAAVLCGGAGMLAPEGKQAKSLKMILSVVFMCVLLSPLGSLSSCRSGLGDIASPTSYAESGLLDLVEEQTAGAMSGSVETLVSDQLEMLGFTAEEITVDMDISGDGCISIGQVVVTVNGADDAALAVISERLYDRLGLNAKVVKGDAENEYE